MKKVLLITIIIIVDPSNDNIIVPIYTVNRIMPLKISGDDSVTEIIVVLYI